jgi:hypothetical protein
MKIILSTSLAFVFSCLILSTGTLYGQEFFKEDFEDGSLPQDWSIETLATDGGYKIGSAAQLQSEFWPIPDNGSGNIIATNDDACNCNKSQDYLILPPQDFSGYTSIVLNADIYFGQGSFEGITERATLEVSTDGGSTWSVIEVLEGVDGWGELLIDLSAYAGQSNVSIAFHYNDRGGWIFGLALDNISLSQPPQLDIALKENGSFKIGETGAEFPISIILSNVGLTDIQSVDLELNTGNTIIPVSLDQIEIPAFTELEVELMDWIPSNEGDMEIVLNVTAVNGDSDENPNNDVVGFTATIYPKITRVNKVDEFLGGIPMLTSIADAGNNLDKPNDLDFFPILAKNELWVINEREAATGGSTVTFFNPGTAEQSEWFRVDGNAWHFMSLPTAIEFGDKGFFATSPGVQDANHSGGTFTGPTLWTSDPEIYAQPSGGNGSHMDMLHGSPYSMGIAHEIGNVYWIFDSWNGHLVRYDFVDDHGPGNSYHGDAIVRRYREINVSRDNQVPSHMVLDKDSGWLYVVDNGSDRVLRVNINSGSVTSNLPLINEPLEEHSEVTDVEWEVIISEGLDRPCGIDFIENRLLVGDYATGEIIVFDMDNGFTELGRIPVSVEGLTGIKIGPQGNLWFTNKLENTLSMAEPGLTSTDDFIDISNEVQVYPNPGDGLFQINKREGSHAFDSYVLTDLIGRILSEGSLIGSTLDIRNLNLSNGLYQLSLRSEDQIAVKTIQIQR